MKPLYLNCLLLMAISCLQAQNNYADVNYFNWDTVKLRTAAPSEAFKHADAVILCERNKIVFSTKARVLISRLCRIQFLTEAGVKKYAQFFVPGTMDPDGDYYELPAARRQDLARPAYTDFEIKYCEARKVLAANRFQSTPMHSQERLEKTDNTLIYPSKSGAYMPGKQVVIWDAGSGMLTVKSFQFRMPQVKAGETYDIFYQVEIPLDAWLQKSSSRIFFHSEIPKQDYSLSVSYPYSDYYLCLLGRNGAAPVDSSQADNKEQTVTMNYVAKDLPGLAGEINARPYAELPHLYLYLNYRDYVRRDQINAQGQFSPQFYDWSYLLYKSGFNVVAQSTVLGTVKTGNLVTIDFCRPYSTNYVSPYDDILVYKADLSHYISYTDKSSLAVNRFMAKHTGPGDNDPSGILRATNFHNYITRNFSLYTKRERHEKDEYLLSLGELAERNKLYEAGRYKLYADILYKTTVNFYRSRMIDKRYETLDKRLYYPLNATSDYFSLLKGNEFFYFIPKSHGYGHFINEYPFYFEGTQAVTTPFRITDTSLFFPPSFSKTRTSSFSHNLRLTTMTVMVDLDKKTADVSADIQLSGQFSTTTRGLYSHNYRDSTINPRYHLKLADGIRGSSKAQYTINSLDSVYPFKCSIHTSFRLDGLMQQKDSLHYLDLAGFIQHIYHQELPAEPRKLDYYSDFLMHDIYRITVRFNRGVTIDSERLPAPINNSYAVHYTRLKQNAPEEWVLESNYKITAEKVPAASFKDVIEINQRLIEMSNFKLAYKP